MRFAPGGGPRSMIRRFGRSKRKAVAWGNAFTGTVAGGAMATAFLLQQADYEAAALNIGSGNVRMEPFWFSWSCMELGAPTTTGSWFATLGIYDIDDVFAFGGNGDPFSRSSYDNERVIWQWALAVANGNPYNNQTTRWDGRIRIKARMDQGKRLVLIVTGQGGANLGSLAFSGITHGWVTVG